MRRALSLALALLAPPSLLGQEPVRGLALDSGAVVRLQLRAGTSVKGKLVAPFGADSTFRLCNYPAPPCTIGGDRYGELLARDVLGVEERTGDRGATGIIIGALAGLGLAALSISFQEGLDGETVPTGTRVGLAFGGILFGVGMGYWIGSSFPEWTPR